MQWEMHRGSVPLLGLWSPSRTLQKKLGIWVTPGKGKRVGLWWTLTWIVSRLVRELDCVKSQVLVKNSRCKQEEFTQKILSATV